ncbi:MAG: flagellar hook protein, partial [Lachnospiraceae bacterium]|nr:flagellar hook protein [Lachnospiraceae bacterium]
IVSAIDSDKELSSMSGTYTAGAPTAAQLATAAGQTLGAGHVVTMSGEKITATAEEPATMNTVKGVIKELQVGDKFTIGTTTKYTIADKTDIANSKLSVDDALALVNDGDTVKFETADLTSPEGKAALTASGLTAGTAYTAVETKVASNEENVISVKDAYKMMAEELTKASSIGTDEAAVVKSNNSGSFSIQQGTVEVKDSLSFNLHVGADADMTNKITVDISAMDAAGLGIKGLNVSDNNGASATYAIDAIADAISKVSSQRSALGAVQNRLEHTIANLDNVVENTTAAESRIRDTDMAEEMVTYSKNNILAQAGQSMLAQANQSNQGVLSLLQ